MAYTKTFTITNGNNATASEINTNFSEARDYINHDIAHTDVASTSVDFPEIVRGEYSNVTGVHQFTFGHSWGNFVDRKTANRNPFTKWSKSEVLSYWTNQATGAPEPSSFKPVVMWQTVPDTCVNLTIEENSVVTYRAWIEVVIPKSLCVDPEDNTTFPEHRYTTFTALIDPTEPEVLTPEEASTRGRHYDECAQSNPWGTSSWAGPPAQDPMRDQSVPDGFANNIASEHYRRMYCITKNWQLSPGDYRFGLLVDAHHENGYFYTTNVTLEVQHTANSF